MPPKTQASGSIPLPWYDYECYQTLFHKGLPIVIGKTPVSEELSKRMLGDKKGTHMFTPSMLMQKFNLGLVINFTDTDKYYKSQEFLDEGIDYLKVMMKTVEPNENQPDKRIVEEEKVQDFLKKLKTFLHSENSRGKVVYFHSTFGHYRLEYMFCRFLTLRGFNVEDARKAFKTWRRIPDALIDGGKQKRLNRQSYELFGLDWLEPDEDWWSEAVEKKDLAKLLSETHLGKGKQLIKKASSSSANASEQSLDCEMESQVIQTEPSIILVNRGSHPGLNVRTKLSRNEDEPMESEAVDGPQQSCQPTPKKKRTEELKGSL